ncbi:PhoX family phosphatase [Solimonas sp. SE-A11]|uniref:PhoX family protein n=1 Tax=Solimonas sp. SE-A11 TaxID=3054954 RepID=UPI00259D30D5|nr:PhoX family phosphatase [Solimonas sp. SE-A11]MDM4771012.1 PhoX family phosphatase [Solimonas sp. SE-A11]
MSHHHDVDVVTNNSDNPHILDVVQARFTRRQTLLGGLSATTAALFGGLTLTGCDSNDDNDSDGSSLPAPTLNFSAVEKNQLDKITVPAGYSVAVLYALGDALDDATPAWADNGTETAESYEKRAGDNHDGMYYFGLSDAGKFDANRSDRGLLCMNHEYNSSPYIHPNGYSPAPRPEEEALKEINCHGVSVIEVKRTGAVVSVIKGSAFNRRITPNTVMDMAGPVSGTAWNKTLFDATGKTTRGTINNCANGYTPWGTYLTCEENWNGFFKRPSAVDNANRSAREIAIFNRYNLNNNADSQNWSTVVPADASTTVFSRWDATKKGTSTDGSDDFRHEPHNYGWIVEIDPFTSTSRPKKRTALGRFAHEGCWPAKAVAGQPLVWYMGDDNRGDYIYKFVSKANWDPADIGKGLAAGDKYMNEGTLYVARFKADGSGDWAALAYGANGLDEGNVLFSFANQADILVATRIAADAVGATKMDRPEWGAVNPVNGEVYMTLTNSNTANRLVTGTPTAGTRQALTDAANPRVYEDKKAGSNQSGNVNGHIIRWREDGSSNAATTFKWDVYLFGAQEKADATATTDEAAAYQANVNVSSLKASNDFSSPDGLWFDPRGVLWIQTDDGAYTDVTNCMMLAAVPGKVGDGSRKSITSKLGANTRTVESPVGKAAEETTLRRFLVGPKQCEVTGIAMTPDGKTMFLNIQHPGEESAGGDITLPATYGSHWPDTQANATSTKRPRSATVVISRNDGGVIGI